MAQNARPRQGTVVMKEFESRLLAGNAAGDPPRRTVPVYLPPGYADGARRFPVIVCLTGFSGRGVMLLNEQPWQPNLAARMDRLIASGTPEAILVMPDCFTRYGGSQYLDSSATGRYESHLVEELLPWVDREFRTHASREGRGVMGKSSGGYGAIVAALKHPDLFSAVACHSGDMYFEYCYLPDIPKAATVLGRAGGLAGFLQAFDAAPKKSHDMLTTLNVVAMAACYSPNADAGPHPFDLPFDLETGELRQDVFDRWLQFDPIRLLERHSESLRRMQLVFLDCGMKDEWNLHLGARIFARRLRQLGIAHRHEEFDDGHMDITYRYDVSLPLLAKALQPAG